MNCLTCKKTLKEDEINCCKDYSWCPKEGCSRIFHGKLPLCSKIDDREHFICNECRRRLKIAVDYERRKEILRISAMQTEIGDCEDCYGSGHCIRCYGTGAEVFR